MTQAYTKRSSYVYHEPTTAASTPEIAKAYFLSPMKSILVFFIISIICLSS